MTATRPLDARATLLLMAVVTLFSGDAIARKVLLGLLPAPAAAALVFAGAGLLVAAGALWRGERLLPADRGTLGLQLLNGAWFAAFNLALQAGLAGVGPGWGNALLSTFPFFTLLASALVLRQQALKPALVAGMGVAFLGALALTGVPAGGTATGKALVALAALLLGTQLCLVRVLAARAGALPTIAWQHLGCAAICAVVALAFPAAAPGVVPGALAFVGALAYEVLVVHAACAVAQALLLARHGAAEVGAFSLARPVVGLGLAWAIAGEAPAAGSLAGAALVATGLLVIYKGPALLTIFQPTAKVAGLRARFGLTARVAVLTQLA